MIDTNDTPTLNDAAILELITDDVFDRELKGYAPNPRGLRMFIKEELIGKPLGLARAIVGYTSQLFDKVYDLEARVTAMRTAIMNNAALANRIWNTSNVFWALTADALVKAGAYESVEEFNEALKVKDAELREEAMTRSVAERAKADQALREDNGRQLNKLVHDNPGAFAGAVLDSVNGKKVRE